VLNGHRQGIPGAALDDQGKFNRSMLQMQVGKGMNVLIGIADDTAEVEGASRANSSGYDEKSSMIPRVRPRNQTNTNSKH